jgi:SPP1 gp7 family putative phage head morphogenesis protein
VARRKLSRAQRFARAPRAPTGVILAYRLRARKLGAEFARRVRAAVGGKLGDFALERRTDAASDDALGASVLPSKATIRAASNGVAEKALQHSKGEFKRIGIRLSDEPGIDGPLTRWRKDTVARMASILERERANIVELLKDSEHRTPEELQDRIEERFVIAQSKLETAAHDDILTLNGRITQERQTAAGIDKFIWTTAGEGRVRDSHAEIDGQVFDWDDPPEVDGEEAIPGEPPNCRCVAYPVLDELADVA